MLDAIGYGELDLGEEIPDFWEGDSWPNQTSPLVIEHEVLASNGIDVPNFVEPPKLEDGTPLKTSEFNSSNPTPSEVVLGSTPSSTVNDSGAVELKLGPMLSGELSKQNECSVSNDDDEGDSQSAESPTTESDTDIESDADCDACFGVVS